VFLVTVLLKVEFISQFQTETSFGLGVSLCLAVSFLSWKTPQSLTITSIPTSWCSHHYAWRYGGCYSVFAPNITLCFQDKRHIQCLLFFLIFFTHLPIGALCEALENLPVFMFLKFTARLRDLTDNCVCGVQRWGSQSKIMLNTFIAKNNESMQRMWLVKLHFTPELI
jgi:hypothetical protein